MDELALALHGISVYCRDGLHHVHKIVKRFLLAGCGIVALEVRDAFLLYSDVSIVTEIWSPLG
jgi:hypothetical protein